jgi:uncharacterized membrane protein
MTLFTFYAEMQSLARQEIAELFVVLILTLLVSDDLNRPRKLLLFIMFGTSLTFSHYGLSYIFMISLVAVWTMLRVMDFSPFHRCIQWVRRQRSPQLPVSPASNRAGEEHPRALTVIHVVFFVAFTNLWYNIIAMGTAFHTIIEIGDNIRRTLVSELFNPASSEGMNLLLQQPVSVTHAISKYLNLLVLFLIAVGVVGVLLNVKKINGSRCIYVGQESLAFSFVYLLIGMAGIAVPYVASSLNTARLYQISLLFLAPFSVIGGIVVLSMIPAAVKGDARTWKDSNAVRFLSVIFSLMLLFNSGWIYEIVSDRPTSIALSQEKISRFAPVREV